jgi:hypothetical protein
LKNPTILILQNLSESSRAIFNLFNILVQAYSKPPGVSTDKSPTKQTFAISTALHSTLKMADLETTVHDAITKQEIPGCVLISKSRDGTFASSL